MTWLCVSLLVPAGQKPILVAALPWLFTILAAPVKKTKEKQTYMNDFSNKALMTFNHDAPTVSFQALISLSSWYVLFQ